MSNKNSVSLVVVLLCLLAIITAEARPRPEAAASFDDKQKAWQDHQTLAVGQSALLT